MLFLSKPETRNPKSEHKKVRLNASTFRFSVFGLLSDLGFRPSDLHHASGWSNAWSDRVKTGRSTFSFRPRAISLSLSA
jgi:hypothetical protein